MWVPNRVLVGREKVLKLLYTNKRAMGNFDDHITFVFSTSYFELVVAAWLLVLCYQTKGAPHRGLYRECGEPLKLLF